MARFVYIVELRSSKGPFVRYNCYGSEKRARKGLEIAKTYWPDTEFRIVRNIML